MVSHLEIIAAGDVELAYIIGADWEPDETSFLTPGHLPFQMGMIVYGAGSTLPAHVHLPITRQVEGTSECIIVRKGRCVLDIYTSERKFVASRELREGTIVLLLGGGHGFRMLEDTILFEVKQGPYAGNKDKARFEVQP